MRQNADNNLNSFIIADGRWSGLHGIGRFSTEILSRLQHADIFLHGPKPLSMKNLFWQSQKIFRAKKKYQVFFTPGFNPAIYSALPFVFTIHDLIHLFAPESSQLSKNLFYHLFMKPAAQRAYKILTVSEYSKQSILQWANVSSEQVINVSCGISPCLTATGAKYSPGYPYLLHVGNATKAHKNVHRLLQAFAQTKLDSGLRLIFTNYLSTEANHFVRKFHLENRILIQRNLSESTLADYYRGARAVIFPSLYEGFGLPVLEGMACGVPVLTANTTSLPEVAGDAALLVDPYDVDALTHGIEKIVSDALLRSHLITQGAKRAALFSWDKTAEKVQEVLNSIRGS